MSKREWAFTAQEMSIWFEACGRDVLPYPLTYWPDEQYQDEYWRNRRAAIDGLRDRRDEWLERALSVLVAPEVRLEVSGFTGRHRDRKIRLHAGIHHQLCAIVAQQPGRDHDHGGDVTIMLHPADKLGELVVAQLPSAPAGTLPPLEVRAADIDGPQQVVRNASQLTARQLVDRFMDRPQSSIGYVAAYPYDSVDNRHIEGRKDFQWIDFEGDGRYVTAGEATLKAQSVDSAGLAATIQRMVTTILKGVRAGQYAHLPNANAPTP